MYFHSMLFWGTPSFFPRVVAKSYVCHTVLVIFFFRNFYYYHYCYSSSLKSAVDPSIVAVLVSVSERYSAFPICAFLIYLSLHAPHV